METKPGLYPAVFEVLDKCNYLDWRAQMKTYLIAQDLWEVVEGIQETPDQETNDFAFKAWSKKNSMALHVIQISCGPNSFSTIREISLAKIVWNTLAEKYTMRKTTYSGTDNNRNDSYVEYVDLYKAVRGGDWNAAKEFLRRHPDALNAKITTLGKMALHIAVVAGQEPIGEELVGQMSTEDLEILDNFGDTALNEAAVRGEYRLVQCMLKKNASLVSIGSSTQTIPLVTAITYGQIETARYLYSVTPLEDLMPEKDHNGATFLSNAIYTRNLGKNSFSNCQDIALHLVERCPQLALALGKDGNSPLLALASTPNAFPSGNRLVFWEQWIYNYCIDIQLAAPSTNEINGWNISNVENQQSYQERTIVSGIKHLYEMKLIHIQSKELLHQMCEGLSNLTIQQRQESFVNATIIRAIKNGIFEVVSGMLKADPELEWTKDGKSRRIFSIAVLHRQAKIFSLLYGLITKNAHTCHQDENGNGMLHMAGMLADSSMLNHISGAALQMQRELQWFKEIESIVHPKAKEAINKDGLTPRQLFTKTHKNLRKEGEQWMKNAATSCTVVGALIITIMFAAAFTVPGGNNQNTGLPLFLNRKWFTLFILSDALSLFSSTTSVLMFLGILTSRYAEDDFLVTLPRKMIVGFSTLFFSIATMMITFCAALSIMLSGQDWIVILIICLASVPITLFIVSQFRLLVEITISTYKADIFDKKMKPLF
ncbi:hypothetical protein CJ030_MR8G002094 [Morella rubra]|uniref:PGG domain-containing protein n=1 Tax=Morella rubra TaxID=262757 RepID=A0A6A1URN7_9ROSI|nr:hypothetical protein CJ030_MR8G002094 [Morella rubra]